MRILYLSVFLKYIRSIPIDYYCSRGLNELRRKETEKDAEGGRGEMLGTEMQRERERRRTRERKLAERAGGTGRGTCPPKPVGGTGGTATKDQLNALTLTLSNVFYLY